MPGRSGLMPQTSGPATSAGPSTASWVKNERITAAALRRPHLSSPGTPASRRRTPARVSPVSVGGSIAAAAISSTAGRAVRR